MSGRLSENALMRLFIVLMLCLVLATCSSQLPHVQVLTSASAELAERRTFSLIAVEQAAHGEVPFAERNMLLEQWLREGLRARGYSQTNLHEDIQVYYDLTEQNIPIHINVETASPAPLGPYQAVHRLHDETGTLRIRLATPQQATLWEGLISTGLSPAKDSTTLLERATQALLQQIPRAQP